MLALPAKLGRFVKPAIARPLVPAVYNPKMSVDAWCCTTKLENTHGTEFRELLYPWHPWFGLRVCVHAVVEKSDGVAFRCSVTGSNVDRWLEVPAWMFDRSACSHAGAVTDPHADLAALTALAGFLRHALNGRVASSDIPLSDLSRSSRDQNRGEAHATANEVAASAPQCAAADRPVRRRIAKDDRQHAGLVRAASGDTAALTELMTRLILDHAGNN